MSQFSVYVVPEEFQAIKKLPGNVRQRIKRAIDDLADNPRPPQSKQLDTSPDNAKGEEAHPNRQLAHRLSDYRSQ
jgi:mRNA-degrading endonuclease RelE of RelBE toxin-antitoxin system